MHLNQLIILNCKSRKEPEHTGHLRLLYCPAATGEHLTDQQPECTSRAFCFAIQRHRPGLYPAGPLNRRGFWTSSHNVHGSIAKRFPFHSDQQAAVAGSCAHSMPL